MIETRLESATSNPSLGMKKVNKSTLAVSGSGSTTLTVNATYMIHFGLFISANNYDSIYKIKLRFRQTGTNIYDAYLYDSTDTYINTTWCKKMDYRLVEEIMWGATTIGTAICPGVGTAIGFGIGLIVSYIANVSFAWYTSKWIDENIK